MKDITIIGAGMAGLLAGNMLRRHRPQILERQQELPDNHGAVLRFRNLSVGDATGIPFKKVLVRKAILTSSGRLVDRCTIDLANEYSLKIGGGYTERSIWNLDPEIRYISPPGFIEQMARSLHISYGVTITRETEFGDAAVISTMPMPMMMKLTDWSFSPLMPDFKSRAVTSVKCEIFDPECEVFQTIYNVDPDSVWYRATIHGNLLTVEAPEFSFITSINLEKWVLRVLRAFGIRATNISEPKVKEQMFGKIFPVAEDARKRFMLWLTEHKRIYSLGRFATWRPGILLDDLVKDIKLIESMIENETTYDERKHCAS